MSLISVTRRRYRDVCLPAPDVDNLRARQLDQLVCDYGVPADARPATSADPAEPAHTGRPTTRAGGVCRHCIPGEPLVP